MHVLCPFAGWIPPPLAAQQSSFAFRHRASLPSAGSLGAAAAPHRLPPSHQSSSTEQTEPTQLEGSSTSRADAAWLQSDADVVAAIASTSHRSPVCAASANESTKPSLAQRSRSAPADAPPPLDNSLPGARPSELQSNSEMYSNRDRDIAATSGAGLGHGSHSGQPVLSAVEEENRRLKELVAALAVQLQQRSPSASVVTSEPLLYPESNIGSASSAQHSGPRTEALPVSGAVPAQLAAPAAAASATLAPESAPSTPTGPHGKPVIPTLLRRTSTHGPTGPSILSTASSSQGGAAPSAPNSAVVGGLEHRHRRSISLSGLPDLAVLQPSPQLQAIGATGVFLQLAPTGDHGEMTLKRVKFDKARFSNHEAAAWWAEHKHEVYERYNLSAPGSGAGTTPVPQDACSSRPGSAPQWAAESGSSTTSGGGHAPQSGEALGRLSRGAGRGASPRHSRSVLCFYEYASAVRGRHLV